jgi:anthraniloyl-CoA monooxygenase
MSVRISAHDWAPGGNTPDDAVVAMARLFKAAGADFIDVSSGQTTRQARPVYGRMYQTPFSPTASATRWASARSPWVPSARPTTPTASSAPAAPTCAPWPGPHLADPAWTLHEAARLESRDIDWPRAYLSGRDQLYREVARQKQVLALANAASPAMKSIATDEGR